MLFLLSLSSLLSMRLLGSWKFLFLLHCFKVLILLSCSCVWYNVAAFAIHRLCAHEYERRQEMAAAALAYKCMEIAYMRVVYCKHSSTNRDRHELQATLHIVPQGVYSWLFGVFMLCTVLLSSN